MLTIEYLENVIVTPYRDGEHIILDGRIIAPEDIWSINIRRIPKPPSKRTFWQRLWDSAPYEVSAVNFDSVGIDVTGEFIQGSPGYILPKQVVATTHLVPAPDAREVFVVHGRDTAARDALFEFLRAIDLHPLEWSEAVLATGKSSPYIGEILHAAFSQAHAVVVLLTPDDETRLKESLRSDDDPSHETQLTGQARPNVLFEAGMAMAGNQDRTVLVELGTLRPFSDIGGRHVVRLDNTSQKRHALAQRLRTAGCPVNLAGDDWLSAGDFSTDVASLDNNYSGTPIPVEHPFLTEDLANQLSEDAKALLGEAALDPSGMILVVRTMGGTKIQAGRNLFGEAGNRRSEARWLQAIDDLEILGLTEDRSGRRNGFEVTHLGFEVADRLKTPT